MDEYCLDPPPSLPNKVIILFHQKVIKIQWVIQKKFLWSSPISKTSATDIVIVMQISVRTRRLSWCYLLNLNQFSYLFTMTISTVLGLETNTEQSGWWEFSESFRRFSDNFEVKMCSTKLSWNHGLGPHFFGGGLSHDSENFLNHGSRPPKI